MAPEARPAGLAPREVLILSTFTPENAAGLPGAPWLAERRSAAAEVFASSPLPTEKDEVWRYSRIDQLDLDRFQPAGAARAGADPGPTPSERIHALVAGLGPRSGLVITIDGVLATLASTAGDDQVSLGRATDHAEGSTLLGGVLGDAHDFPLLNDAFAIDPVVVDVQPGASLSDPWSSCTSCRVPVAPPCSPGR